MGELVQKGEHSFVDSVLPVYTNTLGRPLTEPTKGIAKFLWNR